jgi:hypothetical protein
MLLIANGFLHKQQTSLWNQTSEKNNEVIKLKRIQIL